MLFQAMHRKVKYKTEQNFNPGLALMGLSGTGPGKITIQWIGNRKVKSIAISNDDTQPTYEMNPGFKPFAVLIVNDGRY